jgi:hypothetical protein
MKIGRQLSELREKLGTFESYWVLQLCLTALAGFPQGLTVTDSKNTELILFFLSTLPLLNLCFPFSYIKDNESQSSLLLMSTWLALSLLQQQS